MDIDALLDAQSLSVGRDDPQLLLLGEDLVAVGLPAGVEPAAVGLHPLRCDLVRSVGGAGRQVAEERLVGVMAIAWRGS